MTKRECAVIMAYTGTVMLTGDDLKYFYDYIAELMGRPVYTHEIHARADDLKEKAKPDFIRLCREAAADDEAENMTALATCDKFICSECEIVLEDWKKMESDDDGEEWETEYEFKFCPNCGRKVRCNA